MAMSTQAGRWRILLLLSVAVFCTILYRNLASYYRHISSVKNKPLYQVLSTASMVDIDFVSDNQQWHNVFYGKDSGNTGKFVQRLDSYGENATVLKLLKASHHFHSQPPQSSMNGGYVFWIWVDSERSTPPHPYVYVPKTGELGRDHEWCYVSVKFRDWMKSPPIWKQNYTITKTPYATIAQPKSSSPNK